MRILGALLFTLVFAGAACAAQGNHLIHAPAAVDMGAFCDNLEGFDHTNIVAGPGGSMVWLRGEGGVSLLDGMTDMGGSYSEVWADPEKRAVYDSVYPPDASGNPRPFGVFMGCEQEMGL